MEEDTIDDAEDNSRSANAEGESEAGDKGEAPVFAKTAQGVAEIAQKIIEVSFQRVSRTSSLTRSRPPNS